LQLSKLSQYGTYPCERKYVQWRGVCGLPIVARVIVRQFRLYKRDSSGYDI
jgi:hypothetical protein